MTIPGIVASKLLCLAKKISVYFGKQCLCCEENAGIERVHPFLDIDVKSANMEVCVAKPQSVQSPALAWGGVTVAWAPT